MADDGKKSTLGQFGEDAAAQFKIDGETFLKVFDDLSRAANQVNGVFTQGRQRISELRTALADAGPDVLRLGGSLQDVSNIISDVAEASRRNVVASTESVEKLFAAQKVLGIGAKELSDAFLNIGAGIESIPKTLEESVQYVQSIGGNAKSVMKDVANNMEQMNRYQFEGGVLGLTKMAAQASMLRFDMGETFRLADRVLSPEGAIETAAAFQRLGVAAGNLADPFALMNASINDPSGLQNSLVDVAKQFTYFDEKTKTFKINPQGVLTLREMEQQTGVSAKEMTKLGLAAAEADKRISEIGAAGLNIKEDDKQYLANIAKMGEGGQYEVKIKNQEGIEQTRKLSEITQKEFDALIKEQKEGPKTLEDIAKAQMTTSDIMMGDLRALRNKFVGGVVTAGQVQEGSEGLRRGLTTVSGAASNIFETKDARREAETAIGDLGKFVDDLQNKNMSTTDALQKYLEKAGNQLGGLEDKFKNSMSKMVEEINKNTGDKTVYERLLKEGSGYILDKVNSNAIEKQQQVVGNQPISSLIEGRQTQVRDASAAATAQGSQKSQVELAGGIKIDINFGGNATELTAAQKEQITKMFTDKMNSLDMKQYMYGTTVKQNPTKSDTQYNY